MGTEGPIIPHVVVGAREPKPPKDDLVRLWSKVTSGVTKYGFVIEYRDLESPRTGIFDGLRIVIDPDVPFEMQCFLLLHLFGHSVQWVAPSLAGTLTGITANGDKGDFIAALQAYEYDAAQFGMQLLREVGVVGRDQWYADFVATDWTYVCTYYQAGALPNWNLCIRRGVPLIKPMPIPVLHHRQVEVRFAF